jgi:hypothetical protein
MEMADLVWEALPFVSSLYLGYLVVKTKVQFEVVWTYTILLLAILAFSLHLERSSWTTAILPTLTLINLALFTTFSTTYAYTYFGLTDRREKIKRQGQSLTAFLLSISVAASMYYPSSWRLTLLFVLFVLDFTLCIALSPAQVYLFRLRPRSDNFKSLEILHNQALKGKETPENFIRAESVGPRCDNLKAYLTYCTPFLVLSLFMG